jgi:FkbM family methyltransferase
MTGESSPAGNRPPADVGSYFGTLRILFEKGVRYATVIDLGCADGHFFLINHLRGVFAGACPINVDANSLYEPSLKEIKELLGGDYVVAAAADHIGETEMTSGAHPYWSSLRPEGDLYWARINGMSQGKVRVPVVTVDSLAERFDLQPPFLLKLDIQGAEIAALRGARETLKKTDVVICESDLDDFPETNRFLEEAGFALYDLTEIRRVADRTLGWFYPVYLSRRLDHVRRRSFWDAAENERILRKQEERRKEIIEKNAELLRAVRAARSNIPSPELPNR